jgi:hypothetical protein
MAMIFPGMDPYLEHPQFWPGVHNRLIVYIADQLQPRLRPRYIATTEERIVVGEASHQIVPDVRIEQAGTGRGTSIAAASEVDQAVLVELPEPEIHEAYVAIIDRASGHRVVAIIEVVSPTNKHFGPGRESYLAKQREVMASTVHLVEIDLLRAGPHVLAVPEWLLPSHATYDYVVSVSRSPRRTGFEIYPRALQEPLPRVAIPLASDDPDVPLNLQAALTRVYEEGAFEDRIDYTRPCVPALTPEQQRWAEALTRHG